MEVKGRPCVQQVANVQVYLSSSFPTRGMVLLNEAMIVNAYQLVLMFGKFSSFLEQSFSNLNHLADLVEV